MYYYQTADLECQGSASSTYGCDDIISILEASLSTGADQVIVLSKSDEQKASADRHWTWPRMAFITSAGMMAAPHELGHSIGHLYDEYDSGESREYPPESGLNCSASSACPEWAGVPETSCIGICQFRNWYRSVENSMMRDANQSSYGPIGDGIMRKEISELAPVAGAGVTPRPQPRSAPGGHIAGKRISGCPADAQTSVTVESTSDASVKTSQFLTNNFLPSNTPVNDYTTGDTLAYGKQYTVSFKLLDEKYKGYTYAYLSCPNCHNPSDGSGAYIPGNSATVTIPVATDEYTGFVDVDWKCVPPPKTCSLTTAVGTQGHSPSAVSGDVTLACNQYLQVSATGTNPVSTSDSLRVWIERQDLLAVPGGVKSHYGTGASAPVTTKTLLDWPSTGLTSYFYNLVGVNCGPIANGSSCTGGSGYNSLYLSAGTELPAGTYSLHCDVAQGTAPLCSGAPYCTVNGGTIDCGPDYAVCSANRLDSGRTVTVLGCPSPAPTAAPPGRVTMTPAPRPTSTPTPRPSPTPTPASCRTCLMGKFFCITTACPK